MHALEHGSIVSKPEAVRWAKDQWGKHWDPLIEQAVASQYGNHSAFLEDTIEFIRFTREWITKREARARAS